MAILPERLRHDGLELPIFDGRTAVGRDTLYLQGDPHTRTVKGPVLTRVLELEALDFDHLGDVLKTADEELDTIARVCGAKVIEHTWGVVRTGELQVGVKLPRSISERQLLPESFTLAAEVSVLTMLPLNALDARHIDNSLESYLEGGGRLTDMGASHQVGMAIEAGTDYTGVVVHDIDPWFGPTR